MANAIFSNFFLKYVITFLLAVDSSHSLRLACNFSSLSDLTTLFRLVGGEEGGSLCERFLELLESIDVC